MSNNEYKETIRYALSDLKKKDQSMEAKMWKIKS